MNRINQIFLAAILVLTSAATNITWHSPPVQASECDDVKFIFARGSGEELGGSNYTTWRQEIINRIQHTNVKYNFYELGTEKHDNNIYEAVAVAGSLDGIINLIGAAVSAGEAYKFGDSVDAGERELISYIRMISANCSETKFVLGGYSQGAMLVTHTLDQLDPTKIIYVSTFGDPKTYLPEGAGNYPDACVGRNLSNYRAYVPDCHAYEGILGSYRPYQPAGYYNKIGLWCNKQDAMCSSGLSIPHHTSYVAAGMYKRAAAKIAQRLSETFTAEQEIIYQLSETKGPDVAIILDTSPHMMQIQYQIHLMRIRELVNQVRSLGGRVALFYYGDARYFKSRCICDFAGCTEEKINQFYNDYAKIGIIAHWGVNSALSTARKALTELDWDAEVEKEIVIFTDKDLFGPDRNGDTINDILELNQASVEARISVYGQQELHNFAYLAKPTGGKVYREQDSATALVGDITKTVPTELPNLEYEATVGQPIYLDASGLAPELRLKAHTKSNLKRSKSLVSLSSSSDTMPVLDASSISEDILYYDWDLDGDGKFEITNGAAVMTPSYNTPQNGFIQVRVRNTAGDYRIALSRVRVIEPKATDAPTMSLKANLKQLDKDSYRINLESNAPWLLVGLDGVLLGKINPNNPQFLIVNDVKQPTTLRLTTYSSSGARGVSQELVLGADKSSSLGSDDTSTGNEGPDQPNQSDQSNQPDQPNRPAQPSRPGQSDQPSQANLINPANLAKVK